MNSLRQIVWNIRTRLRFKKPLAKALNDGRNAMEVRDGIFKTAADAREAERIDRLTNPQKYLGRNW